ncbi:hypothetical protein ACWGIV_01015, partial [Streptomyces sp. NPDC054844]
MTVVRRPRAGRARHRPWPMCQQCGGVALDMGSARTRAWVSGRGMILDVPTVTFPGAGAVYPIQRGSIVDTQGTARMLDRLLGHRLPRCPPRSPRVRARPAPPPAPPARAGRAGGGGGAA